ncbi:GDSL esterase/lipase At4g10955 [Linum perenne]
MESEREDFNLSGPLHLTFVDWSDANHRRSVAASLVQSVYILERDRQLKREHPNALAPPWWEFFHFKLLRNLVDDVDHCIFGAVFEYKPPTPHGHQSLNASPRYVIAFRGTLTKPGSFARDIELDIHVIRNGLHETSRFEIGMQAVRNMVASVGDSNVWLAGHSLGASMAMLAGKTMAKSNSFIQAFLFNPPFLSPPIERIKDERVKHGIRIAGSVITAGLAFASKMKNNNQQQASRSVDPFVALSSWIPCLFVNPADPICSEYVGYFEHRKKMDDIGIGAIEKLATQNSLGGLLMGRESEPLHLIPSAIVGVNSSPSQDLKEAHGIHQWWKPELQLQTQRYKYN